MCLKLCVNDCITYTCEDDEETELRLGDWFSMKFDMMQFGVLLYKNFDF